MAFQILILGEGELAGYVYKLLSDQYTVCRQDRLEEVNDDTKLALVLHDAWHPSMEAIVENKLRMFSIPWIRGLVSFGEGIIGPIVYPDKPGCSHCTDIRLMLAGADRQETWNLQHKLTKEGLLQRDTWGSKTGLSHIAYLIIIEVEKILCGKNSSLENRLFLINLRNLSTSCHYILPDPMCPECGALPEDTPELAGIKIRSSPKITMDSYRTRSMKDFKEVFTADYLDIRTGLLNGKLQDLTLPFADVYVNMPMFAGDEGTAGRSINYVSSELTAVFEGLERYCGIEPRGKKRTVRGTFHNLKKNALFPASVGVHEIDQYTKPDFPFQPFQPDIPINWVWGYSLLKEQSILVPELLAYYSLGHGEGFVYETSNGCALGGSMEEAIFHGILEVVERDSFLITWYAKLPLPRLDLHSANDTELLLMIEKIRLEAGYDLYFYNSTMEHRIPSVWAIAKNRNSKGLNLICAAGANPDPVKAVKSAIFELAGMMHHHDEKLEVNREKYVSMLENPYGVKTMEDHGMLYGLPEAEDRLQFLLEENRPIRSFADEFQPLPKRMDLKDDLEDLLSRFRKLKLEVIVIDQSSPIIKRNGLFCVKVLIPGMLPMTFGHHLTRVKGLERVLKVPMTLGYTKEPLMFEQLNPHPHPFP